MKQHTKQKHKQRRRNRSRGRSATKNFPNATAMKLAVPEIPEIATGSGKTDVVGMVAFVISIAAAAGAFVFGIVHRLMS